MKVIVYVYNSFDDPLFKGNLFLYLKRSVQEKVVSKYYLITYEQPEYTLSPIEKVKIRKELKELGINWYPVKFHTGRWSLPLKIYDFIKGFFLLAYLRLFKSPRWILTLGSISGSFGFLFSRVLMLKQYAYQFEPHSEFLLDMQLVSRKGISYRLFNFFEQLTAAYAEIISTGTDAMLSRLKQSGARAKLFKIASAVDENIFFVDRSIREEFRTKHKLTNKAVFIYVGKVGGIYYYKELFVLFNILKQKIDNSFFVILTPQPRELYLDELDKIGLTPSDYLLLQADFKEIPAYLNAADMGIVAIPPYPSQKYRSPIKVGEYLLCGLPYITCRYVSEDDVVAENYQTGVVLEELRESDILANIDQIKIYLQEDHNQLTQRCRNAGISYRSFEKYYLEYLRVIEAMKEGVH